MKSINLSIPVLLCIVYCSTVFSNQKNIDTLLLEGKACVERSDYVCAKDKYIRAHKSGMSRDSLCYLIAELYINKKNFDTALVFNLACKSNTEPLQSNKLIQHSRILEALNLRSYNQPGSDSVNVHKSLKGIHFIGTQAIFSYNNYQSNTYIPLNENNGDLIFSYDDPVAASGIFDKYIREQGNGKHTFILDLSLSGVFSLLQEPPLQRRFQNISFQSSGSMINRQSGLRLSNAISYSDDFAEGAYLNFSPMVGIPFSFKNTLMGFNLLSRMQFDKKFDLIDGKAGCNLIASKAGNGILQYGATIDLNYNWRPENKLVSIKVGYTDSLIPNSKFAFYLDKECKKKFNNDNGVGSYWFDSVPEISWIKMPEQKVNATLGLNSMLFWKKFWNLGITLFMDGKIFTQKTSWYTIDTISNLRGESDLFVLLYEKSSGTFYDHIPVGTSNNLGEPKPVKEFKLNEKRRFDGTVSAQMILQHFRGHYGNFTLMLWGSQTFSTLHRYRIPIPVPKYSWGITSEYKPIHFVKKPKNQVIPN